MALKLDRRSFVAGLGALSVWPLALALPSWSAEAPARRPRQLRQPITLRHGDRLENLDLTLAPNFRWGRTFAAIFGSDVRNVTIRNVRLHGADVFEQRWRPYKEPEGSPPTGMPSPMAGIRIQGARNLRLEQVQVDGFPRAAITGFGLEDAQISEIDITRCWSGVDIRYFRPNRNLHVAGVRVRDTWGPGPGNWPGRGGRPSKVRPGCFSGGDGVVLESVREGSLRDCDVRGEHFGSYKLVNPMDVEVSGLVGNVLMVQGTADRKWKIHKKPARNIRIRDCTFDKALGVGDLRAEGNALQISWHVHDLSISNCTLKSSGYGGNGIELSVDAHARVEGCTFEGFNGKRGGRPCAAAHLHENSTINDDFVEVNNFVGQQRMIIRS